MAFVLAVPMGHGFGRVGNQQLSANRFHAAVCHWGAGRAVRVAHSTILPIARLMRKLSARRCVLLPSGRISVLGAWRFLLAQAFVGLLVLLQFNWFTVALGMASLVLVAAYPFMKRITYWPQFFLGLTFNWGRWSAIVPLPAHYRPPLMRFTPPAYSGLWAMTRFTPIRTVKMTR